MSDSGQSSQIRFCSESDSHSFSCGTTGIKHKPEKGASRFSGRDGRSRTMTARARKGKRPLLGFRIAHPLPRTRRGEIRRRSCRLSEATHALPKKRSIGPNIHKATFQDFKSLICNNCLNRRGEQQRVRDSQKGPQARASKPRAGDQQCERSKWQPAV